MFSTLLGTVDRFVALTLLRTEGLREFLRDPGIPSHAALLAVKAYLPRAFLP